MNICDAHCHLANLAEIMPLQPLLDAAAEQNITHFLSSALRKNELDCYQKLTQRTGSKVLYSAGIHPFFEACDLEFADLETLCKQAALWAIGEIGLDRGNPEYAVMKDIFVRQLEMAMDYRLPVVLHIVGYQQQAFDILRSYPIRYLIHGYAGSLQAFKTFTRLDSYFTISERILREDKRDLLKAMLKSRRFLFESDITQYYVHEGEANPLLRVKAVLNKVAELFSVNPEILIKMQAANYKLLTGQDI
ncbi:MAG: TatD family hydrolase [Candidatus Cloacimonadaceae bacterium]|jgi:TatD DNase family protein|nr:TatD family hydrolase [Candidatus Cloacimonadota bacterium]MDY0127792.1 TatD family hydrolase [Candidatus Cloacimonadaceae bacterium]MCB5255461.1 TatD family hydrolase [Candidatus Cloacimonadota bacterium]MCK9178656.1 TatD family hydrolase [Candidatus Cloacimonadota bacterium]MCK9242820.1 TatD family hydrolase [Candidatus Cloacimonadota bacterium]